MICKKCGIKISDDSKFCYKCGNATSNLAYNTISTANKNICSNCGNKVPPDNTFCRKCGHKLSVNVNNNTTSADLNIITTAISTTSDGLNTNKTAISTTSDNLNTNKTAINATSADLNVNSTENDIQNASTSVLESISNKSIEQQNTYLKDINIQLEKEKRKNKTYLAIIIGCAVVIFIIIILAIVYTANEVISNNNVTNDTNSSSSDNNTDSIITDNTETSPIKTYTNTEENIFFTYPKNWTDTSFSTNEYDLIVGLSAPIDNNFSATMEIYKIDINLTSELLDKNSIDYKSVINEIYAQKGIEVKEISDTKVGDVDAMKILSIVSDNCTSIQYIYNVNDALYAVTFTTLTESLDKYKPIFDSIMDTYTTADNTQNSLQEQISENKGLTGEQALKVAQEFVDTHPLYDRTITGYVEYEPPEYPYSTKGLYLIETQAPNGSYRSMWVDKLTGSILLSTDGLVLIDAEEAYEELFVSNENNPAILFEEKNVVNYLGGSVDYVYDDFGTNKYGTDINGALHEGNNYIGYDNIAFVYEDESYIDSILGDTTMLTYNGATLDKSRDELVELFGEPDFEDFSYSNKYEKIIHWVEYVSDDYVYRFDIEDGSAYLITIY